VCRVCQCILVIWVVLFRAAGAVDLYTSAPTALVLVTVLAMAIYTWPPFHRLTLGEYSYTNTCPEVTYIINDVCRVVYRGLIANLGRTSYVKPGVTQAHLLLQFCTLTNSIPREPSTPTHSTTTFLLGYLYLYLYLHIPLPWGFTAIGAIEESNHILRRSPPVRLY